MFKDGYNTASRLRKQKESVLCFLEHPWVPWHNNDSETAARTLKRKTKQSDGFKSIEGAREYASFMTVAGTARLRGKNIYKVCQKIMAKSSPARRKRMIKSR